MENNFIHSFQKITGFFPWMEHTLIVEVLPYGHSQHHSYTVPKNSK